MIEHARRLCRDLGGPEVDQFRLPAAAVERAERTGRPLPEAVHDVVSGWLAVRAREGSGPAREQLVRLWRAEVLRWCRWSAGRGIDPEDAAHEVLLRALSSLDRLDRPDGFRAWLWAIAWRVLREQERRPWLRRWILGDSPEPPSPEPRADQALEQAERDALIRQVLQALTLEERTLLWHAYVDGRSRPQIAALCGWPEGTVNRKLTRARARFRTQAARLGLQPTALQAEGGR